MRKDFVISDLHFGHANILKYRTQFKTIEEHDQHIIDNWNKVVSDEDRVYVLGDVAWTRKDLMKFDQMKGTKYLIMGNHDVETADVYLKYFKKIKGLVYLDKHDVWLSHAPIHEACRRGKIVIHGHTHDQIIEHVSYVNVCCEMMDYTPQTLEHLLD